MRIISSFKDYYDGVGRMDLDRSVVYVRNQKEVGEKLPYYDRSWLNIGFCGQIYPVIVEWEYENRIKKTFYKNDKEQYIEENKGLNPHWNKYRTKQVEDFFRGGHIPLDYFDKYETAIFITNRRWTIINPCLRQYNFATQQDPYTAYQNLMMWANNKAEPRKPIPKLDDVTMAQIKGFDKFSFRKDKQK